MVSFKKILLFIIILCAPLFAQKAVYYGGGILFKIDLKVSGLGTTAKSPDQNRYNYKDTVTVTATPSVSDTGWVFYAWSGTINGSTNPYIINKVKKNYDIKGIFHYKWGTIYYTKEGLVYKTKNGLPYKLK